MGRWEPMDSIKNTLFAHNVTMGQIFVQRGRINTPVYLPVSQEGLDLGAEDEAPGIVVVEEWLLAETVPREDQSTAPRIPESTGKHPVDLGEGFEALIEIKSEKHLGVGSR